MLRHRSLLIAQSEQWLVDAEVRETRRALLRLARLHTKLPAVGFLDVDFLAVADRSTVLRAIIEAAFGVGGAAAADLQICDPVNRPALTEASNHRRREASNNAGAVHGATNSRPANHP